MELNDQSRMPFGKFVGLQLEQVPAYYLLWLYDQGWFFNKPLKKYIDDNRQVLEQQKKQQNESRAK